MSGDFYSPEIQNRLAAYGPYSLVIADPPYGQITSESWDQLSEFQVIFSYLELMKRLEDLCEPGASAYVFGGIGKPKFRPFFQAISYIEDKTNWQMATLITWKKLRAYGIQTGYPFTREEIAFFVLGDPKHPKTFHPGYTNEKRTCPGFDPKYPPKSDMKRRTNVWTDVVEVMRNKRHPCEKPTKLYEIMVETSSNPGDVVLEVFCGSGPLGRVCPDRFRVLNDIK